MMPRGGDMKAWANPRALFTAPSWTGVAPSSVMYMLAYWRVISLKNLLNMFRVTTVRQFFFWRCQTSFSSPTNSANLT